MYSENWLLKCTQLDIFPMKGASERRPHALGKRQSAFTSLNAEKFPPRPPLRQYRQPTTANTVPYFTGRYVESG